MDESRRLAMRRAHAKRSAYCTCGKIAHGNGGQAAHRKMHERKGEWRRDFTGATVNPDGHFYMTQSEYDRRRDAAALAAARS